MTTACGGGTVMIGGGNVAAGKVSIGRGADNAIVVGGLVVAPADDEAISEQPESDMGILTKHSNSIKLMLRDLFFAMITTTITVVYVLTEWWIAPE